MNRQITCHYDYFYFNTKDNDFMDDFGWDDTLSEQAVDSGRATSRAYREIASGNHEQVVRNPSLEYKMKFTDYIIKIKHSLN